jgi:hypothetical protein
MLATIPHGETAVNVTVVLSLLDVLLVTKETTPTVVPGAAIVGETLMVRPKSEDCAVTRAGTNIIDKQMVATTLLNQIVSHSISPHICVTSSTRWRNWT